MESESAIAKSYKKINENIQAAIKESPFNQNVRFVAASKFQTVEDILEAYKCGVRDFGENYVDEMVEKSAKLPQDIRWHFIGHLQSNKCRKVMIPNLEYLETIETIKKAEKVNKTVESLGRNKLKVFVQLKTSDEDSKYGASEEECIELIDYIRTKCSHLEFCGLMTIGYSGDIGAFKTMVEVREKVSKKFGIEIKDIELSMGMSNEYEQAIKHGATNVRIGILLFGSREKVPNEAKEKINYFDGKKID